MPVSWDRPTLVGGVAAGGTGLLGSLLRAHPDLVCGPGIALFSHPAFWLGEGEGWARKLHHLLDPNRDEQLEATWEWDAGRGFATYLEAASEKGLEWYGVDANQVRGSLMAGLNPQEAVAAIFSPKLRETGKTRWAEASPGNVYAMRAFLKLHPEGRGILVIRDGRDAVASLMARGWNFWRAAATWLVEAALCKDLAREPRILVVRYEDLVAEPRRELQRVTDHLGLAAIGQEALRTTSVGRWKNDLTPMHLGMLAPASVIRNVPGLESIGGVGFDQVLRHFGYEPLPASPPPVNESDVLAYAQSLTPPGFPVPFPMTHVDFPPLSGGRQLVNGMLHWIWGQVSEVQRRNRELEAQLEAMRAEKSRLEYKIQRKSGKVGAMRELTGRNRGLDTM